MKEIIKTKQRIKVKQKSKQTPQRAPVVAINWLAAEAFAGAWRYPERTAVAMDLRQHRTTAVEAAPGNGREQHCICRPIV